MKLLLLDKDWTPARAAVVDAMQSLRVFERELQTAPEEDAPFDPNDLLTPISEAKVRGHILELIDRITVVPRFPSDSASLPSANPLESFADAQLIAELESRGHRLTIIPPAIVV